MIVYDEGHPRGLWRLGRIKELIHGVDGKAHGVHVRVVSKNGHVKVLRRPIQHICQPCKDEQDDSVEPEADSTVEHADDKISVTVSNSRP